ncbi:hypothetical protein R1flu_022366 [Riccia fluitans]|uniref:Uncharacterized protein n=1 Tax=Riccia fluitans TaxID=41844 RepID=A0ABD1ZS07_9MARC
MGRCSGELIIDVSPASLRMLIDFPNVEECNQFVMSSEIEAFYLSQYKVSTLADLFPHMKNWFDYGDNKQCNEGGFIDDFCHFSKEGCPHGIVLDKRTKNAIRTGLRFTGKSNMAYASTKFVLMAMAHVDPELPNLRPDWHQFIHRELVNSLSHTKTDLQSRGKFREGWFALVEMMKANHLSKKNLDVSQSQLLLEDPRNAFQDTLQARWDAEKGELVRETEQLKGELAKAKGQAVEAEEKSKNLLQEKELLKEEFRK